MSQLDSYRETLYTCEQCGWNGPGKDCIKRELFRDLFEIDCPSCGVKVGLISFPLVSEILSNAKQLTEIHTFRNGDLGETRTTPSLHLYSLDQLPEIMEDFIILTWDVDDQKPAGSILIKHGSRIIWQEPLSDHLDDRFIEVGEILKARYGTRLKDIIPTTRGERDLYGQSRLSFSSIYKFREALSKA